MTEYFEVLERDGAARLGELRLADPVTTPVLVDDPGSGSEAILQDAGSEWPAERAVPEGDEAVLTVLPHRALPGGTPEELCQAFTDPPEPVTFPSAAVVTPETAERVAEAIRGDGPTEPGHDAYVLSNVQELAGHARAFVEAIIRTREAIPADTALYLSGIATPANVATLVTAGVDLVDTHRTVAKGTRARYLTSDGEQFLEDLEELPCACPACQQSRDSFTRADCVDHNVNALQAALATVRHRIHRGTLRDYLEGQARHENWCTAAYRRLDQQYGFLEQRTPILRRATMQAASEDSLRRVEIQRFAERVTSRYRCRFDTPLVLVPCSASKPYSRSQSHGQFHDAVQWRGHMVSITSPIGVVPQELELTYPAQHYDSVVTGHWSPTEIEFVGDVLAAYLDRTDYPRHIVHLPGDYRPILNRALEQVDGDLDVEFTAVDHPTATESLGNLAAALEGELTYPKRSREHYTIKAVADYQIGAGAGDALFPDLQTESRYPKLRALDGDGEQLATLVAQYGVLAFTLAGARRWLDADVPTKRVEIDDFVPHGSVLAPGVLSASDTIRVGDEVVIEGPRALGIGRAEMSGPEMAESTRGIASSVRHVAET